MTKLCSDKMSEQIAINCSYITTLITQTLFADKCCYVGWWMVLAGDEQGYAPASLLEPTDDSSAADDDAFSDKGM